MITLNREIKAAKVIAEGNGMIAVNIMRAVTEYASYVRQNCVIGADAVVVGTGLPPDFLRCTRCRT